MSYASETELLLLVLLHMHVIVVKLVSLTGSDVGWREGETYLYRRGRAHY